MYEYAGDCEEGDEELEVADDTVGVYDGVGVFGEFVGVSVVEMMLR